jgi:hypothetical protein
MFNIIVASLVTGVITASGAHYLSQVEAHSVSVSDQYVLQAHDRFDEYDKILPGIVYKHVLRQP